MKRSDTFFILTFVGLLWATGTQSHAGLTFFPNDLFGWELEVAMAGYTVEPFDTGPDNIAKSNEVELPPPDDRDLGTHILTFDKANTDLSGSFTFATQQAEQHLLYRELPTGDLFPFDRPDAVEMEVIDGSSVYALALEIFDLDFGTATVEVFSGETSLGSTSDLAIAPDSFLGIVSAKEILRLAPAAA